MKHFSLNIKDNYNKYKEIYKNILIIFLFLILPYIFFTEAFSISKIIYGHGDLISLFLPLKDFLTKNLINFNFPLWNPLNGNGFPFLADIQACALYPINIIFGFIFPLILSYNILLFFHYSLAGIFSFFFIREYNLSKFSAFICGLVFMFSGFLVVRKCHPQMIFVIVWLPLILMFLEKFIKRNNFKYLLIASIFFAVHFFAGFPQIFVYAVFIELSYFVFIYIRNRSLGRMSFKRFISGFLIFLIFGIGLITIQLLPTYELMGLGFRVKINYEDFTLASFNLKNFFILFFPYIFGKVNPAQYKDVINIFNGDYIGTILYLGTFSFFLALLGINIKNRNKWFWIFLAVFVYFGEICHLFRFKPATFSSI